MSDEAQDEPDRFLNGLLGCLPGWFFGATIQWACRWNVGPDGPNRVPWQGMLIGIVIGYFFGGFCGHFSIQGRVGHGILSCIIGTILGLLLQAVCGGLIDDAGNVYFPWLAAVGGGVGLVTGFTYGRFELPGRAGSAAIGATCGSLLAIAPSLMIGALWPASDMNERRAHVVVALVLGPPIGAMAGGVIGFCFGKKAIPIQHEGG